MTIMDEENVKGFPLGWAGIAAKPCDSCKSAAALLFCRPDSAFLCISCDSKVHGANKLSTRHERVWMCEVCEQAPAAVTCKADAAALCVTCDADIHSANPLARRHDRVPVEPFYDSAESLVAKSSSSSAVNNGVNFLVATNDDDHPNNHLRQEEAEAASWILPNPNAKLAETTDVKTGELCFSDFDHLLEFDYANSIGANFKQNRNYVSDSVVPVQNRAPSAPITNHQTTETCFDIDFCKSKLTPYNYTSGQSLSHSVSSSSMDFGVVPDGSVMSDISYPFAKQINGAGGIDNLGGNLGNQSSQLPGMDREARVLRYREKRKNRKFEKTIRYASRKAYAETRPRIKGRFAKRTEMDLTEVDRMFNPAGVATFVADSGYGVVPSY